MPRILFLSNIPTPYQLDFLGSVAAKADIRALFLWSKMSNHDWTMQYPEWITILDHKNNADSWDKTKHLLDEFKPDIVIVGGYRLPLAQRMRWYAFRNNIRFYYWLEKPLPNSGINTLLRWVVRWLTLPFADGVLCIGSEAQKIYSPPARRTLNLPYSIDLERYRQRGSVPATLPLRFLFIGQFISRKGVPELLEAFAAIAPDHATLSLAGSGELEGMVDDFSCRYSHIRKLGYTEPSALPTLISEYDVLVLPSRHDGWAVVIAEALAVGLSVIGTLHTGAFVDLVHPHGCGIVCDVTCDSIRNAVHYYITHPEKVRAHGTKGREYLSRSLAVSDNAAQALLEWVEK